MSGQGRSSIGAVRTGGGDDTEPDLKRRRLLDAGPVEDDETARRKMRDAKVWRDENNSGFGPENIKMAMFFEHFDDHGKITPMGYFASNGDLPMMRWLYVHGADTRDEEIPIYFPMYAASRKGNLEACKWLYDHGADNHIKWRTYHDRSPLGIIIDETEVSDKRDLSRWLILRGALCKDDDSGDLDLGLMRKDLTSIFSGCRQGRQGLLEWANGLQQDRETFFVFLMATLSPPEYSPMALRELFMKRLQSERGAQRVLDLLPSDQLRLIWNDLFADRNLSCPPSFLCGLSGVLEKIGDFVGVVRGREARIIRQLAEILPDLNVELDQKYER